MAELAIHRFRLSLARAGGYGWGPDRERVFAAMKHALPAQIGEALAARLDSDHDLEINEPVRLGARVTLAELAAACASDTAMNALATRLVAGWTPPPSVAVAIEAAQARARAEAAIERLARIEPGSPPARDATATEPVIAVLLDWHARGELATMLAGFSIGALRRWLAVVVAAAPGITTQRDSSGTEPVALRDAQHAGEAESLRTELATLVETLARHRGSSDREATSSDSSVVPPGAAAALRKVPARSSSDRPAALRDVDARPSSPPPPRRVKPQRPRSTTTIVDGFALPFLLLRPLAQIGYLDALAASFSAADRDDALPGFAAALALQVLRPPRHGWQHDATVTATAAAFAGDIELPALDLPSDLVELRTPMDRVLARAVLGGHDTHKPLLLHRRPDGIVLVEPDGLFPVAWCETLDELLAICSPTARTLAIAAATAEPSTLTMLDARDVCFVTDAPPSRRETWRRPSVVRAWTNARDQSDSSLTSHLSILHLADDIDELIEVLAARTLHATLPAVQRSVGLAAAVALGDLAYRLWRDREPTSPQLALARFSDLTARIELGPHHIDVRIPRGARYRDLDRCGFLATVRIPWLAGRTLNLGGD